MAILEKFGKKMGEAAQVAAKKSSELMEVTKLNISINAEEDKEKKLYAILGKKVFESLNGTTEENTVWNEEIKEIKACRSSIENLRIKILEVKNTKSCAKCGSEMEKTALFCAKCGDKQIVQEIIDKKLEVNNKHCSSCGFILEEDGAFCPNCGEKLA